MTREEAAEPGGSEPVDIRFVTAGVRPHERAAAVAALTALLREESDHVRDAIAASDRPGRDFEGLPRR